MIRFTMPDSDLSRAERIESLEEQFCRFMASETLSDYLSVLKIKSKDIEGIYRDLDAYNMRVGRDGQIRESQVVPLNEVLEENREKLFPIYKEFGLVTINKPIISDYDRIVLLGGSANSNFDKTQAAKASITDTVTDVSALGSFRPIPPGETRNLPAIRKGNYETEFGSFDAAFNAAFDLIEQEDDGLIRPYDFPRNLNLAYRIKTYRDIENRRYRIFASPSLNPEERAGTYDTCVHYLNDVAYDDKIRILVITNNQYSNYQFLPFMTAILESGHDNIDFDIIGCSDDNHLATPEKYNTNQYYGDIRAIIQWIMKFYSLKDKWI